LLYQLSYLPISYLLEGTYVIADYLGSNACCNLDYDQVGNYDIGGASRNRMSKDAGHDKK
jgi:hypothetical protein